MILLHVRHRKLVRTRPAEVSLSDLAPIKKVFNPGTRFRKSKVVQCMAEKEEVRPFE